MTKTTFDAVVIGGGPGGYVCAIRLAQLGLKVACIEKENVGGVCLNWGCIPSKALISVAHTYERAIHGSTMGLLVQGVEVDAARMQSWKNGVVDKLTGGIRQLFKANGVTLIEGKARVTSARSVEITRNDGTLMQVDCSRAIVVATGATTIEIGSLPMDGKQVIGAKEAVSLPAIPKRLCVVGGGVIGLELGTVYHKLGAKLTVVEALPQLLTGIEPDCTQVVERKLKKSGAKILKNAKALGYERQADGSLRLQVQVGDNVESVDCDVLLVAVGMRPNGKGLGLEQLGVIVQQNGAVTVDEKGATPVEGVYAIGDVTGPPFLAHRASKQGEVVAEVIAGQASSCDWVTIPAAVFTDPEIASAGMTTEQATAAGYQIKTGKFPFAALGRALAMGESDGFIKTLFDASSERLLGVHIVGPSASDLIAEAALALEVGTVAEDIAMTVHAHPTLAEGLMESAAHALGHAIHAVNR
ncbi:MAG TPA: dihydrolipoyl dehydrogenase [Polyangiaceae bacterium]|jgi:dihydrolipoamide dehydrogenase|nr:MAG: Dihydrolipoyl dehydrogenase [Deltaproteobacteria bacterium ADurb.Bin207]HNS99363.1 dihydrolipoyl dehydrogenase [Polyangiaceae bacterium]HNZ24902.1 dihydrolipoyl dehydrogenase [Polyangiaceae bacterium]HOE51742.1 dihydrolipoyl dehydrogenase [Polyangiaceae bacterium]HOH03008.1 dihydrolipoyl dehydrogenase [Polyangiaceae bacterium]